MDSLDCGLILDNLEMNTKVRTTVLNCTFFHYSKSALKLRTSVKFFNIVHCSTNDSKALQKILFELCCAAIG